MSAQLGPASDSHPPGLSTGPSAQIKEIVGGLMQGLLGCFPQVTQNINYDIDALAEERYERAAKLRDEILKLES